jgi:hypothetical protein
LTGQQVDQVGEILAKLGLKMDRVALTGPSRALPGTILSQSPPAGSELPPGSVVVLRFAAVASAPGSGWCCIQAEQNIQRQQSVGVIPMGEQECASRNGAFFKDEKQARWECRQASNIPSGWERADVFEIQGLLARNGYYKGPMDGVVGNELTKALMGFQERSGLMPDGLPGPQTLSVLRSGFANAAPPAQRQYKK